MAYTYQNLEAYRNTGSGVGEVLYVAPIRWFNLIAAPPAGDVVITDPHTFLSSANGFIKFLLAPEKNQLEARTVGQLGSQKLQHEARIFIPGSYAEVHEMVRNVINEPVIVLIPDADCEEQLFYQLGSRCTPAWVKCDFTTGTTIEGQKGYLATITYIGKAVLLYEGTIQLPDGSTAVPGIFTSQFTSAFA